MGFAWLEPYDEVDDYVRSTAPQHCRSVRDLAQYLCAPWDSERYKARAIFSWLAFVRCCLIAFVSALVFRDLLLAFSLAFAVLFSVAGERLLRDMTDLLGTRPTCRTLSITTTSC